MSLRLVKSGEPGIDPDLAERWEAAKAAGDKLIKDGALDGLWLLLDAGEASVAFVHGDDPVALMWAVKRTAEGGIDQAVFGE